MSRHHHFASRYAKFIVANRWLVMGLLLVSTLFAAFYVPQLNLRNDPDSLLPQNNPYIATNLYAKQAFGMGNIMVWGMEVKNGDIYQPWFIKMVRDLYHDMAQLKYANEKSFIGLPSERAKYMRMTEGGSLEFNRLLPSNGLSKDTDKLQQQLTYLRQGIESNPVLEALLIYYEDDQGNRCEILDDEGKLTSSLRKHLLDKCAAKATFIVGSYSDELKDDSQPWIREHRELMKHYESTYGDRVRFIYSGEPFFLASMILEITEKSWLFVLSVLIILIILWYEFRNWRGAVFPLIGVGMTLTLTLGLMGYTQFSLTTMMVLTPMLLLAVGIGHSVQIMRRFLQEAHHVRDVKKAAEISISRTMIPATLSIVTDVAGFFTLSFVDISFYKAYAYFGMFGMATLILTTTTLIPLLMSVFPPADLEHDDIRLWEQRFGQNMANLLTGKFKWIPLVLVFGIISVSLSYTGIDRGLSAIFAGEAGRSDPEIARIQDEMDIMPSVEKGINFPRAAYKESYWLGEFINGDQQVRAIADMTELGTIMPGVVTANIVIRAKDPAKPVCGLDAWNKDDVRIKGPEICFDQEEDPPQGVINDAEVLSAISQLEDWLRAQENIGFTVSYIQFVRTINLLFSTPVSQDSMDNLELFAIPTREHMQQHWDIYKDPEDETYIPDPDASVQLYNGLIEANSGAGELDTFVNTSNWDETVVIAFIRSLDIIKAHKTMQEIQNYLHEHRNDPGMDKLVIGVTTKDSSRDLQPTETDNNTIKNKAPIGGFLGITEATRDVAIHEWLRGPISTALAIFIITLVIFRSLAVSAILLSLLIITLLSQYGLGGYMTLTREWSANLAFHVQVALSIAMGLGVDYGIYMMSRLRDEMRETGGNWKSALQNTLSTTGSGVLVSVVVLLGSLIPLMSTELANTWSISLYIGEALILDVIMALMFLPLMVYWLKPGFVFRVNK